MYFIGNTKAVTSIPLHLNFLIKHVEVHKLWCNVSSRSTFQPSITSFSWFQMPPKYLLLERFQSLYLLTSNKDSAVFPKSKRNKFYCWCSINDWHENHLNSAFRSLLDLFVLLHLLHPLPLALYDIFVQGDDGSVTIPLPARGQVIKHITQILYTFLSINSSKIVPRIGTTFERSRSHVLGINLKS